jgi:hypothetical protein
MAVYWEQLTAACLDSMTEWRKAELKASHWAVRKEFLRESPTALQWEPLMALHLAAAMAVDSAPCLEIMMALSTYSDWDPPKEMHLG